MITETIVIEKKREKRHGNDIIMRKRTTLLKIVYKSPNLDHKLQKIITPTFYTAFLTKFWHKLFTRSFNTIFTQNLHKVAQISPTTTITTRYHYNNQTAHRITGYREKPIEKTE